MKNILVVANEPVGKLFDVFNKNPPLKDHYHFDFYNFDQYVNDWLNDKVNDVLGEKVFDAILFDEANLLTNCLSLPYIKERMQSYGMKCGYIVWDKGVYGNQLEGHNKLHLYASTSTEVKEELDSWFEDTPPETLMLCENECEAIGA